MKKLFSILFTFALFTILMAGSANAQIPVTVTNPGNTTPNLLAAYPSLAAALTDLNLVNAMTGPVTLTLTGPNSETTPPTGLIIGSATLNPVLSVTNTVLINTTGGTVTLNAGVGTATPGSAAPDGILAIVGADYITIDGLTFTDGNASNPATMEFGVALFKLSTSDGAQFNTIRNCIFNMQSINNASGSGPMVEGSVAINVVNSLPTAATTALTPASAAGTNSSNKFYTNTINGGNYGIVLSGYAAPTPFTLGDTGNDIGGSSAPQGNQILNYGGAAGATNPAAGIRANFQWGVNMSYNMINNNNGGGVNHVTTLRGIYGQAGVSANATINYNNITIKGGALTSQVAAIENVIGSTAAGNTVDITNNNITGEYLTATSGAFYGIYNQSTAATVNMNFNNVHDINYSGAALAGSGSLYLIYNSGAATNINANNNTINNIARTGTTGGTTIGIYFSSGTNQTANTNTVSNMSISGTGASSTMYGIQTSTGTVVVNSNNIFNLNVIKTTGTGSLYGMYNIASPTNENFNNNTVYNLTHSGTGTVYGIYAFTATGTRTMSGNTVYALSTAGTTIAGINNASSSPNVFKNKVYNIQSTSTGSAVVSGIIQGSLGTSGVANIYNNYISDLKSPNGTISGPTAPAIRGINITTATSSSAVNVSYNTIYLNATSTAVNFGTAGLFATASATATTAALTLKNNIIDDNSTPLGTGFTVAYQRSTADLANYVSTSNNNDFYASTIFYNGTAYATLAAYKALVTPRDAASFDENPPFVNVATTPYDLHINTAIATQVESGGVTISSPIAITTDYDGDTRNATTPDIGADEFAGIGLDLAGPVISYTPLANTSSFLARTLTTTITDYTGVPTAGIGLPVLYWKINAGAYSAAQGSFVSGNTYSFTFGAGVALNDIVSYFVVAQDLVGTPNVNGFPAGGTGYTANPPNVTTPTSSPYDYKIVGTPLSGTYTIGINPFNKAIGKNLYGKTLTRTVKVEAPTIVNQVDDKVSSNNESKDSKVEQNTLMTPMKRIHNKYNEDSKTEKKNYIDITEEYTVLYENDHPYTGENFISLSGKGDAPNGYFSTITAAMTDLYERGTTGNVTFTLVDNAYNVGTGETFPIYVINPGSFNVTIKPTLPNTVISSSTVPSTDVLMYLAGNNVTIDGAVSGSTRDLTISSTGLFGWTVYFGGNSSGNTLKNCKVNCGSTQSATGVVQIEGGTTGTGSNNHTIDNCEIYDVGTSRPQNGVILWGNAVTANGNTVKNCDIHDFGNVNGGAGVYFTTNANNSLIQKNNIYTTTTPVDASGANNYGIYQNGNNTGTIIEQNNIHDLANANSAAAIKGIYMFGFSGIAINATIKNNSISLGSAFPMNGATIYGIDDFTYTINKWYMYYNSVRINGTATTGSSRCFVKRAASDWEFFNNIGYNNRSGGTANYGIYVSSTTGTINMNYNDYYADGTAGMLGYWGADQSTLLAWQTASSKDANSVSGDPLFISATNLHIQTSGVSPVSNAGTYIATALNDIDGDVRSLTTPDIGADEYSTALTMGLTAMLSGYCNGATMNFTKSVTVELHNSTTPFALVESQVVTLNTSGVANPVYTTAVNGTPYYIVLKTDNGLETWSATPQTFTGSALSYDFTDFATKAFGSNMLLVGAKWCIISGDVNQDASVDALDRSVCWNERNLSGVYASDLNGDGTVDALDRSIAWNNRNLTVSKPVLLLMPERGVKQNNNGNTKGKSFDLKLDGSNSKKVTKTK